MAPVGLTLPVDVQRDFGSKNLGQVSRSIAGKEYRPDAKQPDGKRAPGMKEWKGHEGDDGKRYPGKPEKRPPRADEIRKPKE